ncbi:MAG: glycoside hydrolase family 65 protein [Propionibacteriaceae bacterium]|jgi:alpha,alpha-trehalose phosphorylase|nr:glycoside hydrolase family 65 protein [Propionibacteriaceae bacterium]
MTGIDPMDRDRFPLDPWALHERLDPPAAPDAVGATLFALANGHLGVRGDGPDSRGLGQGSFVNGFHETAWIDHPEPAYGLAQVQQWLVGLPDLAEFVVTLDGRELTEAWASRLSDRRSLDFRTGLSQRWTVWGLPDRSRLEVEQTRLVSLTRRDLAAFRCAVRPLDRPLALSLDARWQDQAGDQPPAQDQTGGSDQGTADPRRGQAAQGGDLERVEVWRQREAELRAYRCPNSGLRLVVGRRRLVGHPAGPAAESVAGPIPPESVAGPVPVGASLALVDLVSYQTDQMPPEGVEPGGLRVIGTPTGGWDDLVEAGAAALAQAAGAGWTGLVQEQAAWLADFWRRGAVEIEAGPGSDGLVQAVHWALFQLAQATAWAQGHGVGAKGLSGSGYCGHYFWDSEIYLAPFLTYTDPARARALLEFRHAMLPAARRRARLMDQAGALFPWRTIDGEEASAYFPAGTAQYHIDADIAFATAQYVAVSGDRDFLAGPGVDLLVETARLWDSLGHWGADGLFHLHQVTGPDEYSALVDDNFFTNTMAAFNLQAAADALAWLRAERPSDHAAAVDRLAVGEDEPARWRRAGRGMSLAWEAERGVHPQDAAFLNRPPWEVDRLGPLRRPLLLHHHPLVIYRHQVLKQADVVLALLLRSNQFSWAQKRADFDFYDALTTGDSTLSAAIQAIVAAEVGRGATALDHFHDLVWTDLADQHGNTRDGVHIAAAAGVWAVLVQGFGGLRDSGQRPSLDPRLPAGWRRLAFRLRLSGQTVAVDLTPGRLRLSLVEGDGLELVVQGQPVWVGPQAAAMIDLP